MYRDMYLLSIATSMKPIYESNMNSIYKEGVRKHVME